MGGRQDHAVDVGDGAGVVPPPLNVPHGAVSRVEVVVTVERREHHAVVVPDHRFPTVTRIPYKRHNRDRAEDLSPMGFPARN